MAKYPWDDVIAFEGALCDYLDLPLRDVIAGSVKETGRLVDGTVQVAWDQLVDDRIVTRSGKIPEEVIQQLRAKAANPGS